MLRNIFVSERPICSMFWKGLSLSQWKLLLHVKMRITLWDEKLVLDYHNIYKIICFMITTCWPSSDQKLYYVFFALMHQTKEVKLTCCRPTLLFLYTQEYLHSFWHVVPCTKIKLKSCILKLDLTYIFTPYLFIMLAILISAWGHFSRK